MKFVHRCLPERKVLEGSGHHFRNLRETPIIIVRSKPKSSVHLLTEQNGSSQEFAVLFTFCLHVILLQPNHAVPGIDAFQLSIRHMYHLNNRLRLITTLHQLFPRVPQSLQLVLLPLVIKGVDRDGSFFRGERHSASCSVVRLGHDVCEVWLYGEWKLSTDLDRSTIDKGGLYLWGWRVKPIASWLDQSLMLSCITKATLSSLQLTGFVALAWSKKLRQREECFLKASHEKKGSTQLI